MTNDVRLMSDDELCDALASAQGEYRGRFEAELERRDAVGEGDIGHAEPAYYMDAYRAGMV